MPTSKPTHYKITSSIDFFLVMSLCALIAMSITYIFFKSSVAIYATFMLSIFLIVIIKQVVRKTWGAVDADNFVEFPLRIAGALFIFFTIGKIGFDTTLMLKKANREEIRELSQYAHTVVIHGWERQAAHEPNLNDLYENIFSQASGTTDGFMTEEEWMKLGLSVPYVPYKGHEQEWHYAAEMLQEMRNLVRMFQLDSKFKVNYSQDLERSLSSEFTGWIMSFRMWLNVPLVRNVWEQYKYTYDKPKFSAWVQYYVINPVEQDPDYFKHHRAAWNLQVKKILATPPQS